MLRDPSRGLIVYVVGWSLGPGDMWVRFAGSTTKLLTHMSYWEPYPKVPV